jgi:hypothetical protein
VARTLAGEGAGQPAMMQMGTAAVQEQERSRWTA